MKKIIPLLFAFAVLACKKDLPMPEDCYPDLPDGTFLNHTQATVKSSSGNPGSFYISPDNMEGVFLIPCNLESAYEEDDLRVMISGQMKSTVQIPPGPFYNTPFVIHTISR